MLNIEKGLARVRAGTALRSVDGTAAPDYAAAEPAIEIGADPAARSASFVRARSSFGRTRGAPAGADHFGTLRDLERSFEIALGQ